MLLTVVIMWK